MIPIVITATNGKDAVDDSLIELQQAPSAEGLALLNGHKF